MYCTSVYFNTDHLDMGEEDEMEVTGGEPTGDLGEAQPELA